METFVESRRVMIILNNPDAEGRASVGRTKNMLMKGTVQSVLSQLLLAFVASIVRKIVQKERKLASVFTRTEKFETGLFQVGEEASSRRASILDIRAINLPIGRKDCNSDP
uniref:Uncharacterized protein n=1 Tax=Vespula pensylvanica TaxID=30213 RepID=A0A834P6M1_VESPE|nr:hypothetical protein H0235_006443 [Vespula pensylvanica]